MPKPFDLIQTFTEAGSVVSIPKPFLKIFGLETAYFLTHLLHWDRWADEDGFFAITTTECAEETGLTGYGVQKARNDLENRGLLETKVMRANGSPTVHYRLIKEAFVAALDEMEIPITPKQETSSEPIPETDKKDSLESSNPIAEVDEMDLTKTQNPTLIDLDIQVDPNTEIQDQIQDHNITSQASLVSAERPPKPQKRKPRVSAGTKRKPRNVPAAVAVFQSETGYYPRKSWWPDLETITDLDRWRAVCHAWAGSPYQPTNVLGAFECYQENRMPTTKGAKHESSSGVKSQPATPEVRAVFRDHFAAKRRASELEAVRAGAGPER